jgi:hypothetical protein
LNPTIKGVHFANIYLFLAGAKVRNAAYFMNFDFLWLTIAFLAEQRQQLWAASLVSAFWRINGITLFIFYYAIDCALLTTKKLQVQI